eukprot:TRINITY_DN27512_c0_g1_i1.p1 TRINITY_DN27512_c0_g1~~TRINITY_DN27512_c0_g1_i1.p1  ORF type:complete len:1537 (-),score=209.59 TRINITY_DN27512_c0_g1_i1:199-4809(-)
MVRARPTEIFGCGFGAVSLVFVVASGGQSASALPPFAFEHIAVIAAHASADTDTSRQWPSLGLEARRGARGRTRGRGDEAASGVAKHAWLEEDAEVVGVSGKGEERETRKIVGVKETDEQQGDPLAVLAIDDKEDLPSPHLPGDRNLSDLRAFTVVVGRGTLSFVNDGHDNTRSFPIAQVAANASTEKTRVEALSAKESSDRRRWRSDGSLLLTQERAASSPSASTPMRESSQLWELSSFAEPSARVVARQHLGFPSKDDQASAMSTTNRSEEFDDVPRIRSSSGTLWNGPNKTGRFSRSVHAHVKKSIQSKHDSRNDVDDDTKVTCGVLTAVFALTTLVAVVMVFYFELLPTAPSKPRKMQRRISESGGTRSSAETRMSDVCSTSFTRIINGHETPQSGSSQTRFFPSFSLPASMSVETVGQRSVRLNSGQQGGFTASPTSINERNNGFPNFISNTRFTALTWLPKSFFAQFHRIVNVFYLYICVLCVLGSLGRSPWNFSPFSWASMVIPVLTVMLWSALKDLYEDLVRRRDDKRENSRTAIRYDHVSKSLEEIQWGDVRYGDMLYIETDTTFPADLLLLRAAGGHEAFMSTANLDGETNLKERYAPELFSRCHVSGPAGTTISTRHRNTFLSAMGQTEAEDEALCFIQNVTYGRLTVSHGPPSACPMTFEALLHLEGFTCSAGNSNFFPRGCVLRNTPWAVGLVMYTGDETKTRLNTIPCRQKVSHVAEDLQVCVVGLLGFWAIWCFYCAAMSSVLLPQQFSEYGPLVGCLIKFFTYNILFYVVVPISLYVAIEVMKIALSTQVARDPSMYAPSLDEPGILDGAIVRHMELIEELGQVNVLFSDKTGTLTCNEMVFARCSVAGSHELGDFRSTSQGLGVGVIKARAILANQRDEACMEFRWFFLCLALCHSCQAEQITDPRRQSGESKASASDSAVVYSGPSPDEVALVRGAQLVGVVFEERDRRLTGGMPGGDLVVFESFSEQRRKYTCLYELSFTSDRKRMSVVIRDPDGQVFCISKGADSVMLDLLEVAPPKSTLDHITIFSNQGLRTLIFAYTKIDPVFFETWDAAYTQALLLEGTAKEQEIDRLSSEIETGLAIVGVTAVEDRLQDGVPQTIQALREALIRIWVLTGDKTETAVAVARSCALFSNSTPLVFVVDATNCLDAILQLRSARRALATTTTEGGLVLDGITVKYCLESVEACKLLYEVGMMCKTCICCRLSPVQKVQLIGVVRGMDPSLVTMAVGDGGNDVPMITGAHVGVGIRGQEGNQAVLSSDVAISQFRFLMPLLLCHGRRAYFKVSTVILFYVYKSFVVMSADVLFSYDSLFVGKKAFNEWLAMGYATCFTSWHAYVVLTFFEDVPDAVSLANPSLYCVGTEKAYLNGQLFATWILYAAWHGSVAWLVPHITFGHSEHESDSPSRSFWVASATSMFICLVAVVTRLFLYLPRTFTMTNIIPSIGAVCTFFPWLFLFSETPLGEALEEGQGGVFREVFTSKISLTCIFIVPWIAMVPDIIDRLLRAWRPTQVGKLIEDD